MARRRERLPLLALAAGSVAALFFILPLAGLLWRAPWGSFISDLGAPDVRTALRLSPKADVLDRYWVSAR